MRVSHLRYKPIEGGTLGGLFALHVTLGVGDGPESFSLSSKALLQSIRNAYTTLDFAYKGLDGVLFDCLEAEVGNEEMLEVLGTLQDWGVRTIAWVGADKRHPWFEKVNYLTVFVAAEKWPNFKASEIRVCPDAEGNLLEPELLPVNAGASAYFYGGDVSRSMVFLKTAKQRRWGYIAPNVPSIGIEVLLEKEAEA